MVSGPVLAHLHGVKKSFWKNIEVWPTITRADGAATCQVSESTQAMSEFCIHLDTGSKYQGLPSGYVKIAKMAIEIVDFPMKNGGSFHSFLYVYQRVSRATSECQRKKLFNAIKNLARGEEVWEILEKESQLNGYPVYTLYIIHIPYTSLYGKPVKPMIWPWWPWYTGQVIQVQLGPSKPTILSTVAAARPRGFYNRLLIYVHKPSSNFM